MKSTLRDVVQHTYGLGNIDLLKITGTAEETLVNAIAEDRSVILEARFKAPIAEFVGTFWYAQFGQTQLYLKYP
jgi:hypothetical protein